MKMLWNSNRQVLLLDSEKDEMKAKIKELNEFIDKNKNVEVTKVSLQFLIIYLG